MGENFSHHSLLCFAAQGQGSICVLITGPEKKIIISLGGEKRALLIHCSQISSFIKSRLNISKAKWLPSLLAGDQIEESQSICCLTPSLTFIHWVFSSQCVLLFLYVFITSESSPTPLSLYFLSLCPRLFHPCISVLRCSSNLCQCSSCKSILVNIVWPYSSSRRTQSAEFLSTN